MALPLVAFGCAQTPNPSFPITQSQAQHELTRMTASPRPLDRPVVVIGGLLDPGIASGMLSERLGEVTDNSRIINVSTIDCCTFDACRKKVIDAVEAKFPAADPRATVEVDVVGMSMGGLVARYAGIEKADGTKHLRIARLFTISSPLAGAEMAENVPPLIPVILPMRQQSKFLMEVNASPVTYPVFSYVRLGDLPVGPSHASLPGRTAWWLDTPPLSDAHIGAMFDDRIIADIARRIRDEQPLTLDPPAPLPLVARKAASS